MLIGAVFLPLTLSLLERDPVPGSVADAVRRVELDARVAWQCLLGDPDRSVRGDLAVDLRRLSLAVGGFVGADRWNADGRMHRDRVTGYQLWLEAALAEGDGAGFARAFAGYDEAVARAVAGAGTDRTHTDRTGSRTPGTDRTGPCTGVPGSDPVGSGVPGSNPPGAAGWPAGAARRRSGTMAGWARQAGAATFRVTMRAARRRREPGWTTSRRVTSSSRWSRRSRSAG